MLTTVPPAGTRIYPSLFTYWYAKEEQIKGRIDSDLTGFIQLGSATVHRNSGESIAYIEQDESISLYPWEISLTPVSPQDPIWWMDLASLTELKKGSVVTILDGSDAHIHLDLSGSVEAVVCANVDHNSFYTVDVSIDGDSFDIPCCFIAPAITEPLPTVTQHRV